MTEKTPTKIAQEVLDGDTQDEAAFLKSAIDWVVSSSNVESCCFCGSRMTADDSNPEKNIKEHLKKQHQLRCSQAYSLGTLDVKLHHQVQVSDRGPADVAGVTMQDTYDRYDALYVPPKQQKKADAEGSRYRWVAERNVNRMLNQGAEFVPLPKDESEGMPGQTGHTVDGNARSNEMALMKMHEPVWRRRERAAKARIERGLISRKEELRSAKDGAERDIYDKLKREGYETVVAGQVAKALANQAGGRTDWRAGDPSAHEGLTITDQRGTHELG